MRAPPHSGSKRLKPAENKFTQSGFTNSSMQIPAYSDSFRFRSYLALHIQNMSNCCRHKYDPSISRFFQSNFWRVSEIWPNCLALLLPKHSCCCSLSFSRSLLLTLGQRGLLTKCLVHSRAMAASVKIRVCIKSWMLVLPLL